MLETHSYCKYSPPIVILIVTKFGYVILESVASGDHKVVLLSSAPIHATSPVEILNSSNFYKLNRYQFSSQLALNCGKIDLNLSPK